MNFLRRIYLLLVSLLLIIVVTALLLSPDTVIAWVGRISEISSVIRIVLALIFGILLLALMYVQIRPDRYANMTGLMMRGTGAVTEVSIESARERILKAVSDVPDVISAEAQVKPVNGKADIEMQVVVYGRDVKLPGKQKEINRALSQVIDKQLGLRMAGQPRIHIRLQSGETSKPVLSPPPATTLPPVEREPVVPPPPVVPVRDIETEEDAKSSGGLFSGWRLGGNDTPEDDLDDDATIDLPVKPTLPTVEPISKSSEEEDDLPSPSLSSLLSEAKTSTQDSSSTELPAKPIVVAVDDNETLRLDLDEELAHSATNDLVDDELIDMGDGTHADSKLSDTNTDSDDEKKEDHPPFA